MKPLFPIFLILPVFASLAFGQTNISDIDAYEAWTKHFRESPISLGSVRNVSEEGRAHPYLVIAVVTDPKETDQSPFRMQTSGGYVIRSSGEVSSFSNTSFSRKGGCCSQMSVDELRRSNEILAELPSDDHRLPPNGRRLVIQRPEQSTVHVRVFDLAFLPDNVLELLRVTKARIRTVIPSFAPEAKISEPAPFDLKAFVTSADGRFSVTTRGSEVLRVQHLLTAEDASLEFDEVRLPQNAFVPSGLTLSSDGSTLIAGGWGTIVMYDTRTWRVTRHFEEPQVDRKYPNFTRHHFIESGKYLVFETGEFGIRVFDTAKWIQVAKPESIPRDASSYYDFKDSRVAVFQASGKLTLRTGGRLIDLVTLGEDSFDRASFSPDGMRVAVVTTGLERSGDSTWRRVRIRILDAADGKLIHELRPYESFVCDSVDGAEWTRDGKYFLAATKSDSFFSNRNISVWDARSGRHIGELEGCGSEILGMRLLNGEEKVVAGCADDRILTWDFRAALNDMVKFQTTGIGPE
ncbi:MAG: hypothetical protein QM785_17335 [Pyrinomonadaceae bacterium]